MRHYSENHFVPLLVDVNWEAESHLSLSVMRKHERTIWFVDRLKQVHFFNGNKSMTICRETSAAQLLWRRCLKGSNHVNIAKQHCTNQAGSQNQTFNGLHYFSCKC